MRAKRARIFIYFCLELSSHQKMASGESEIREVGFLLLEAIEAVKLLFDLTKILAKVTSMTSEAAEAEAFEVRFTEILKRVTSMTS